MRAFFLFLLCGLGSLHAAAPVVSNISAAQRANSRLVDITYDVAADFPTVSVSLQVSNNGGSTFAVPATTLSGAIGAGVATGTAKTITWNAGADWSGQYSTQMRFKVIANDGSSAPTISDIAAQTITAGNNTGAIAFTVGDDQTAAGLLTLSGSSNNTSLVPNANIVFGGSGANRTVTVTPVSSQTGTATITVTVSDGSLSTSDSLVLSVVVVPAGLALIPAGAFTMGDSLGGISDAPARTVTLDAFYIGKYEVTMGEWREVRTWGLSNGYTDLAEGYGKASNHPVNGVTWYDIVKWCNARSQKEGLIPAYFINDEQTTIYKTGSVDVTNEQVNWMANGYRLPTEAEWEKAARGGLSGKRFPWGDTISHSQANYRAYSSLSYDLSGSVNNYHPNYYTGSKPYTSPVGSFPPNGYGLYDVAGNTLEKCWDWYGAYAADSQSNPRGPTSGTERVYRGGFWEFSAGICRVASRSSVPPQSQGFSAFRVARSLASDGSNTAPTISDLAAQTINEGGNSDAIAFKVAGAQGAAGSLTLSGSSSNTTLVPNANIVFGGSGANRTVTVTPASGQSGTSTITVTVSDGLQSTSDTFVLTVNSATTISDIAAQTITVSGNTGAIAFTVGDGPSVTTPLALSGSSSNTALVPNANIVFGGSGANRTVTVTPASNQTGSATITVTVSNGSLSVSDTFVLTVSIVPAGMALIPQGSFTMGNALTMGNDLDSFINAPIRTVTLDAFYMGKYEVTKAEWDVVRTYGLSNGYTDLSASSGKASNHPVQSISWYDMVKWCNARSQKEGLTPVYYTDDAQTTIYKTGAVNVNNAQVNWTANGYRLPTEAEWEKAARGGLSGKRFPWGDTISHSQANYYAYVDYYSLSNYIYDLSAGGLDNYHPTYATGSTPYTSPVGAFPANGYGLYDMAGNVWEWCWDWYGTYAAGSQINPRGLTSGTSRVGRGGGWRNTGGAAYCRVAFRTYLDYENGDGIGFRVVRSSAP